MLLNGEPVGLPHVGTLHIVERRVRCDPSGIVRYHRAKGVKVHGSTKPFIMRHRSVKLHQSLSLKRLVSDNAIYTGDLSDHVGRRRTILHKRLRRHKGGALKHTREQKP